MLRALGLAVLSLFFGACALSTPSRRRTFEVETGTFFVNGTYVGLYRFASAALSWEFRLESPFGMESTLGLSWTY